MASASIGTATAQAHVTRLGAVVTVSARIIVATLVLFGCAEGRTPSRSGTAERESPSAVAETPSGDDSLWLADSLGLSVAAIPPQADTAEVRARLGAPDSTDGERTAEPQWTFERWHYRGLRVDFDHMGRMDGALITSDLWPTRRGLRVGDSTTRMRALYGTPQRNAVEDFEYYTSDQEKGLALMVFDSVGVVRSMYLQVSR